MRWRGRLSVTKAPPPLQSPPMIRLVATGFLILALGRATPAAEPETIELRGGRYWETVQRPTTAPATDETLDRVGQLLENNSNSAAKRVVLNWIKQRPKDHPLRDRA